MKDFLKLWQTFNWKDKSLMVLNFLLHPWKILFLRYKKVAKELDIKDPFKLKFQSELEGVNWLRYFIKSGHGSVKITFRDFKIHLITTEETDKRD